MYSKLFLKTIVLSFFCNVTLFSQEYIPIRQVTQETVKGDMRVIGNSILGVKGSFDSIELNPNDPYNGNSNNGTRFTISEQLKDQSGNLLYISSNNTPTISPTDPLGNENRPFIQSSKNSYNRAYIDIDSDPSFSANFNPALTDSQTSYGGVVNNNGTPTSYSNKGTFSSSASYLNTENGCAKVVKAFLYWTAIYPNETFNNGKRIYDTNQNAFINLTDTTPRNSFCGSNCEDYTEIKILPPFGEQYYDISINPTTTSNPGDIKLETEVIVDGLKDAYYNTIIPEIKGINIKNNPYLCRADITSLFKNLHENGKNIDGYWTVANINATTGFRGGEGLAGGWTLAVIYETNNPSATTKSITFYDGYSHIRSSDKPIKFNSIDFQTLPAGSINAWIANASLEGDFRFAGDRFSIETETSISNRQSLPTNIDSPPTTAVPLRVTTSDNSSNFFDSSITDLDGYANNLPNSKNTLGYDTDHFKLDNPNNTILNNGVPASGGITDTNATLYLSTRGDSFGNFFTAFAVEIPEPKVMYSLSIVNNNNELLSNNDVVNFEEELKYELTLRNYGNDIANNIILNNILPANVELLPEQFINPNDFSGIANGEPLPSINVNDKTLINEFGISYTTQNIEMLIPDLGAFSCNLQPSDPNTDSKITDPACGNEIKIRFGVKIVDECSTTFNKKIDKLQNFFTISFSGIFNNSRIERSQETFSLTNECKTTEINNPTLKITDSRIGCNPLSVNDESIISKKIVLYPNPSPKKLNIGLKAEEVNLTSISGNLIKTFYNTSIINIQGLEVGFYFVTITYNNQIYTRKFIKK